MADKQMTVHVTISAADQASPKVQKAVESLRGLEGALRQAQASSEQFKAQWDATFAAAGAVGGKMQVAGAALLGLGGIAVKTASDFGEMSSMAGEVFKSQTEAVTSWADATGEALNRSSADLLQYAAGFQGLFTPMGIARGEAAQMSEAVATLAVDLGSFWNKQEPDVIRDLQSAFAGETESMRKYGVFLSDAALDQELFNRGIKGGSTAATEAEKAHARMAIIMRATKDAQGDAARTSGSLENQLKGLKAELKESAIAAGQALVPALEDLAPVAKEALQDLTAFLQTPAGEAFVRWAAGAALAATGTGAVLSKVGGLATGLVSMGSLGASAWELLAGKSTGAAKAAEAAAGATATASRSTGLLASAVGALTSPMGLATAGMAALGLGIWRLSDAYREHERWSRDFQTALDGVSTDQAVAELEEWRSKLAEAAKAQIALGNAATGAGRQPVDPWESPGVAAASTERAAVDEALAALEQRERAARDRMRQSAKGSIEYLRAEREALQAHYDQLAITYEYLNSPGPKPGALKQRIRETASESAIYEAALQRNKAALDALIESQSKSEQLTKAQTKANEDAIKAADGYADAQDAAAKATADVAEAIEAADKRVREATQAQSDAWRDAAERIVDAQQAVADAIEDGAERVQDAQERVAEARQRASEAEVDAAEQIEDLEESLADARERAAEAAEDVLKTEKEIAADRVKIEQDAAEKIESTRKSTADKLKSLAERMAELQAKLRGDDKGNTFLIGGRLVMVSDKEADAIRERLKLMEDIRKVQEDIAKAKADEAAKTAEIRKAEGERLVEWQQRSGERREQAAERAEEAGSALGKAERRTPRRIAQAEERVTEAYKAVADAEESLADAREDAARRIADSQKALAKATEAAAKAINDAEEKRLDAEAARAKTFATISEKLEQVAERLGLAWMKLDATGRASTIGAGGAVSYAASRHQTAMSTGRGLMSINAATISETWEHVAERLGLASMKLDATGRASITAPDVQRAMAAFNGASAGAPSVAGLGFGARAAGVQSGSMGGTATVIIGLEPGLVARQLQQDPARGVVVQIARATAAKSPGRSTY